MRKAEALSGAPIYRGRWAAIFWIWTAGLLAGDMDLGVVWAFIPEAAHVGHTHWGIDAAMGAGAIICLLTGLLSLDQYGRNAWFAWAPDNAKWGEIPRSEVNRKPVINWASAAYDWNRKVWVRESPHEP